MRRVFAVFTLFLLACEAAPAHDSRGAPIFGGEPDDNPAVVAITYGAEYFCSGTLIAPNAVLTAGHCLEGEVAGDIEVFFGTDANTGDGLFIPAAELIVHEDYDNRELVADIALVMLSEPASFPPVPYLPADLGLTDADVDAAVDYSGFGLTESGTEGVKLHVGGSITDVCESPGPCADRSMVPGSFAYEMDLGGPCTGDSGGPTFLERGDFTYVVGVTSYGDARCLDYGVNTSVSDYADWLEPLAGPPTLPEVCDDDLDNDNDGATDCDDDDCDCSGGNGDGGDDDGSGCGCRSSGPGGGPWILAILVVGLAFGFRRRRRRR